MLFLLSLAHAAAEVLSWPGGTWLVGIAGGIVIGAGLWNVYRGVTRKFEDRWETGRMSATDMCCPGWYMIQPRGSGPNGESMSSPLACSIFHDSSRHVPWNCFFTQGGAGRSPARRSPAARPWELTFVAASMRTSRRVFGRPAGSGHEMER